MTDDDQPRWPRGAPDDGEGHGQGGRWMSAGDAVRAFGLAAWAHRISEQIARDRPSFDRAQQETEQAMRQWQRTPRGTWEIHSFRPSGLAQGHATIYPPGHGDANPGPMHRLTDTRFYTPGGDIELGEYRSVAAAKAAYERWERFLHETGRRGPGAYRAFRERERQGE